MKMWQEQAIKASAKLEEVEQNLSSVSKKLAEYNRQLKSKKLLIQYNNNKDSNECASSPLPDDAAIVCSAIEMAFSFLKGKHASTKAKILVESIMSGKLFKGEADKAVNEVMRQYIRSLF